MTCVTSDLIEQSIPESLRRSPRGLGDDEKERLRPRERLTRGRAADALRPTASPIPLHEFRAGEADGDEVDLTKATRENGAEGPEANRREAQGAPI